jgi:hypothetical protein
MKCLRNSRFPPRGKVSVTSCSGGLLGGALPHPPPQPPQNKPKGEVALGKGRGIGVSHPVIRILLMASSAFILSYTIRNSGESKELHLCTHTHTHNCTLSSAPGVLAAICMTGVSSAGAKHSCLERSSETHDLERSSEACLPPMAPALALSCHLLPFCTGSLEKVLTERYIVT